MALSVKRSAIVSGFILLSLIYFIFSAAAESEVPHSGSSGNITAGEVKNKILLINSYHKGLSWTDEITRVIERKLAVENKCELYIEYLDAKRFSAAEIENSFYNLLRTRYKNVRFKTVIVSDNNALAFAKKYRTLLFPRTPVIFCGINNFTENLIDRSGWFTGVVEKTDAAANFNIIKKIYPGIKNCIIIGDNTPTGEAEVSAAKDALGGEKDGVKVVYLTNLSMENLLRHLQKLNSKDDAVLLTVFNRDAEGHYFNYEESARLITESASVPVFGLWEFYIGKGVVGGCMVNARDQAEAAADMALRIVKNDGLLKIGIKSESPNKILFDYAALNRFGINRFRLPDGSIIMNSPYSFFMENLGLITSALLLILSEGTALLLLFRIYLKSRKKALKTIEESEEKYRILVNNSFDVIYRIGAGGIINFVSPSWTVILGHEISDVTGRIYTDFIHPDDVDECREFLTNVTVSTERQSGVDYRVRHIDGSWRFHTSSALPVVDESGTVIAVVGVAKDITDRKNSENEIRRLLQEKELLLQEVHHRIKNNMGTISSLLYLQKDSVKNDIAASALNDARNRVQSMMVIYDKLYRSADFRSISSKDYLGNLIREVSAAYSGLSHIEIIDTIEDSLFDSDLLFPLGIIINELMTNAYKYAFPGNRAGAIYISFLRIPGGLIEIRFRDNGAGMPEELLSGESSGFGMNLVRILIRQINGKLQIVHDNGTEYIITFPV